MATPHPVLEAIKNKRSFLINFNSKLTLAHNRYIYGGKDIQMTIKILSFHIVHWYVDDNWFLI